MEKLKIGNGGREWDGAAVLKKVSRYQRLIITTAEARDDDNMESLIRTTYSVSIHEMEISKWVRFIGSHYFLLGSRYSLRRG